MIEQFAEWYKLVRINATGEQIQDRWDSIQEYCDNEKLKILELVKVFFGIGSDDYKKEFIDYYRSKDLAFDTKNSLEIELLAGTTLNELLDKEIYESDILVAVMCLSYIRNDIIIPDLLSIVQKRLDKITSEIRELENYHDLKDIANNDILKLAKTLEQGVLDADKTVELSQVLLQVVSNFNIIQNTQTELYTKLKTCKEDSNILSWLSGKYSNELRKPLDTTIKQSEVALILGKELSDLIIQYPGPNGAIAFLSSMLSLCKSDKKEISLVEIVDSLDSKDGLIKDIQYTKNTPILLAISKADEFDEKDIWKSGYNKLMGINAEEITADLPTWAYRFYLECMLVEFYRGEIHG